jgi:hypothetical protein
MRKLVLGLVALLSAGTVFTVSAQELDWPIDMVMEKEAADVEVCQDFICTKLREEILVEAAKCRPLANFKRRRMRVRRSRAANSCKMFKERNFELSKGKCSAAIRDACVRAGVDAQYLISDAYNLQKKGLLEKAGFVNMIWKYNEATAPLGSILIYVGGAGHRYGHVEIRVNPSLYCSDHCNSHPVTGESPVLQKKYKLAGVYLPFTSSIQITSTTNEKNAGLN